MRLSESIDIRARPGQVFRFFEEMEKNYLRWHPDHRAFRWLDYGGLRDGSRFYLEERIGGKLLRRTMVITQVESGRLLAFAPASFWIRLLMPRLSFRIEGIRGGSRLEADIRVRTGPLGAWLNRKEFDAVRLHMRQECENLKGIVEAREKVR